MTHPAISITKDPPAQTVAKGAAAVWSIRVTNTGDVTLHAVRVTDPKAADCNRSFAGTFAPGASRTYSCSRPNTQENYANVASVVGTAPDGKKVTDNDSAIVKTAPLKAAVKPKPKPKPKPPVISHEKPKSTG